jgi:hypothetical protein
VYHRYGIQNNIHLPVLNGLTNTMTMCCWVYSDGLNNGNRGIMESRSIAGTGWGLSTAADMSLQYQWNGTHTQFNPTDPAGANVPNVFLPTNQWAFVAMAVGPTNVALCVGYGGVLYVGNDNYVTDSANFVDASGNPIDGNPVVLAPWTSDGPLAIGCDDISWWSFKWGNFNGSFAGVAV